MLSIFKVPVEVYQAFAGCAASTDEELFIKDLMIGNDARAYVNVVSVIDGEVKFTPFYLTHEHHSSLMQRCEEDLVKVETYMKGLLDD